MTWQPGEAVQLETRRFQLRSLGPADATDTYLGWLVDPGLMRFVNARNQSGSREELVQYIDSHDNINRFLLGIFSREDDEHIGNLSALCDPLHRNAKLGVLIGNRDYWGQGAVLEVRVALLDFIFDTLRMDKAWAPCYARNIPALFNYRRLGFDMEGVQQSHVICDGERMDVINFGMRREDWPARRQALAGD